jgi:hypothetical protein
VSQGGQDERPQRRALLLFDLAVAWQGLETNVWSATLRLHSLTESVLGGRVDLLGTYCIVWEEATVSWTEAPAYMDRKSPTMKVGEFTGPVPHACVVFAPAESLASSTGSVSLLDPSASFGSDALASAPRLLFSKFFSAAIPPGSSSALKG